jgi:hypothetical protein
MDDARERYLACALDSIVCDWLGIGSSHASLTSVAQELKLLAKQGSRNTVDCYAEEILLCLRDAFVGTLTQESPGLDSRIAFHDKLFKALMPPGCAWMLRKGKPAMLANLLRVFDGERTILADIEHVVRSCIAEEYAPMSAMVHP